MMISETPEKAKSRSSISVDSLSQTGSRLTSRVKDGWEISFLDTKRPLPLILPYILISFPYTPFGYSSPSPWQNGVTEGRERVRGVKREGSKDERKTGALRVSLRTSRSIEVERSHCLHTII